MNGKKPTITPPPIRREPLIHPVNTDRKLLYLDRLNSMLALELPTGVRANIAGRAQMVCVSIEADLNIGKADAE